jgi:predicted aspartyl protease
LTIPCTLSFNGYSVKLEALADSGANGFVFINTLCAIDLAKFLNVKAQRLPQPIGVKGYNGKANNAITHIIRLHLTVDGRRQYNLPLLILDLGSHDVIIGRKWFEYFGVLIDPKRRCLQWPLDSHPSYSAAKEILVPREALVPRSTTASHQADVDTREQAFDLEDQRRQAGREQAIVLANVKEGPTQRRTQKQDTRNSLCQMEKELSNNVYPKLVPYKKKPYPGAPRARPKKYSIDIAAINTWGMHYNLQARENEAFTTSLYEID